MPGRADGAVARHAFIAALLRIPHIVVAVNKMDLVAYSERGLRDPGRVFRVGEKLNVHDIQFIPISALHGDNVVTRSLAMPWYEGPSLLYLLEHLYIGSDRNLIDVRFPVQWVIRPTGERTTHDYRGYAGQIAAGVFKKGDEVIVLPSGKRTRIRRIETFDGELGTAAPPLSVTMLLEDDIDVSRGDMICRPHNQPTITSEIEAMLCWMTDKPLRQGGRYVIKHTTRSAKAIVDELRYRIDVNTLHREQGATECASTRSAGCGCAPAALLRPVRAQPHDRRLHPHRRDDLRHGRSRDDHRSALTLLA